MIPLEFFTSVTHMSTEAYLDFIDVSLSNILSFGMLEGTSFLYIFFFIGL